MEIAGDGTGSGDNTVSADGTGSAAEAASHEPADADVHSIVTLPDVHRVGGYVRRVRRILDCSQRGLARRLGVDNARVARWETGAVPMTVIDLEAVLALVSFRLVVVDDEDAEVDPMSEVAIRDRAGRRYPAHADLRVGGWWAPRGSWLTTGGPVEERRSAELGDPRIFYGLGWLRDLERHFYGVPLDHPTLAEVVDELRASDIEGRRAS